MNNYKIRESDYKVLLWLSLILSPLISLFIFLTKKNKHKNYIFLTTLVALYATTLIPTKSYDLVRYYYYYDHFNINLTYFELLKDKKDFFFPTLIYLGRQFNLKKEIIPFTSAFFSYFFMLKIFFLIYFKKNIKHLDWIYFLFFLIIDFRSTIFGVRNFLAISLLCYGIYGIYIENKKWIYIFISPLIHIMTAVYVPIILFHKIIICKNKNYFKITRIIFFISFLGILVNKFLIIEIIEKLPLPNVISNHLSHYLTGYWSGAYLSDFNIKHKIFSFFSFGLKKYFLIIFLIFNPIKNISFNTKKLYSLVYLLTALPNILWNTPGIGERYYGIPFLLLSIVIFIYLKENENHKLVKKNLFWVLFFIFVLLIGNIATIFELRETLIISGKNGINFIINIIFNNIDYSRFV